MKPMIVAVRHSSKITTRKTANYNKATIDIRLCPRYAITIECPITLRWATMSPPPKMPFPLGRSGPPSNTWYPFWKRPS